MWEEKLSKKARHIVKNTLEQIREPRFDNNPAEAEDICREITTAIQAIYCDQGAYISNKGFAYQLRQTALQKRARGKKKVADELTAIADCLDDILHTSTAQCEFSASQQNIKEYLKIVRPQ